MSNIRLFFSAALSTDMTGKLDKLQSHYLSKVMRVKENELFSLFNTNGEWEAKVLSISKNIIKFKIIKQLRQKENIKELWLAFSPIKSNNQNFMIQKATELGVTKFLPIIFDRTVVRKINKVRLEKIVIESSEQSNRINVPTIEGAQDLNSFLKNNSFFIDGSMLKAFIDFSKLSSVTPQKSLCLSIKLLSQVYSSCVVLQKFAKPSHLSPILSLHFSAAEFTSNNVP